ncbi:cytochrome P450-dit2 [Steccherinum ochraceum]|uniref:Cytochrome P450-dit2 n=1 Tax=Steccherinum ochraceum TaxID=92696 RepID=A0A4R0RV46_9APHY|nr:cytochrome P450-dit2 [Steccherinum ochraceum]
MALLQAVVFAGLAWLALKLVRRIIANQSSPLNNIPGPQRASTLKSFVFGDLPLFFGRYAWPFHQEIWRKYDAVVRINGFFGKSMLYVYDPKALHHIVVKDQYIYEETSVFLKFSALQSGCVWRRPVGELGHKQQRKILNPVFHTNHMRHMVPTFYRITHQLRNALANQVKDGQKETDILNWMTRTALELVGQGGLGHSFDKLDRDELNPFAENVKDLIPTFAPLFLFMQFLPLVLRAGTAGFRRKILELIPSKRIRRCMEIVDDMDRVSRSILAQKKALLAQGDAAMEHQVGEGKDIMSVLLKANLQAIKEDKMGDEELLGHMSSLIFAAMETTSGALARILQQLSEHQGVQDKLREEIKQARGDKEQIEYDELMALPYLEAVCRETLRLYSPATQMTRVATKDIVLPFSTPIRGTDGTMVSEIAVPKGTGICVGILASNVNKAIWGPDADQWRPDRWLEPLPESVTEARIPGVYSNLMTFLGGGRACIGFKFSQLEMKIVLSVLLETFRFTPADKDVYWNFSGVQFPTIGKDGRRAKMPMRVELVGK